MQYSNVSAKQWWSKQEAPTSKRSVSRSSSHKENDIQSEKRFCNCSCPFLNKKIDVCSAKEYCQKDGHFEMLPYEEDDYGCNYAFFSWDECTDLQCEVFGCVVDPMTSCVWDEQKGRCLYKAIEQNEELKEYIEKVQREEYV